MGTTFVSLDRAKTAIGVPIAAVLLAALLVVGVVLATGWGFGSHAAPTHHRSATPSGQVLDCHLGRSC